MTDMLTAEELAQRLGDGGMAFATTERARLAELEQIVEHGLQTFYDVGRALLEIRDGRLYRETHPTFEAYCAQRWSMSRPAAYRAIDAARVVEALSPNGDTLANEGQARELAPLLRDEGEQAVVEVWRELRDEYGVENVTAKKVRGLVKRRLERKRREAMSREQREQAQAKVVDWNGVERVWEDYVVHSTPQVELETDWARIVDGLRCLREDIGVRLVRQAAECFCGDWTPYFSLRDAIRGRRCGPGKELAADLLPDVARDLFERADVADLLREIDAAVRAERDSFLEDFEAFLVERADQIGYTVDPLLDRLRSLAESLPETELVKSTGGRLRRGGDGEITVDLRVGDLRDVL